MSNQSDEDRISVAFNLHLSYMKVAITFIGTNRYLDFLPKYYESIKENFLPNTEKVFLVFTDGEGDFPDDIKTYKQEHLESLILRS